VALPAIPVSAFVSQNLAIFSAVLLFSRFAHYFHERVKERQKENCFTRVSAMFCTLCGVVYAPHSLSYICHVITWFHKFIERIFLGSLHLISNLLVVQTTN
jgi:hypothetical protein